MNVETAKKILSNEKIPFEIIGNGDTVLSQTPKGDDVITFPISKIILYTCEHQREIIEIPKLIGLPLSEAIRIATNTGLNIKLAGNASASPSADDIVIEQSIPYGEKRDAGCTIILRSITKKYED